MTAMGAGKRRRWLLGLLSALLGVTIALVAVEILVRVLFDEPVQPRFVHDAGYGVRANQPNVTTRHYVPGDYDVRITTNSAGMRGQREYSIARPDGVRRVLILGDSFGFGYGVEDGEVLSAQLEDLLNQRAAGAHRYEVINLSVSGFGQAEELVTYRERGRAYGADVVVIFYFENDIGNNAVSGLFAVAPDGSLTRVAPEFLPGVRTREILYAVAPIRWLFEHSEAWNLVRNRLSGLVQNSLLRQQGLEKFNDTSPKGLELTRALIAELVAETRSDGATPVIVTIPDRKHMASSFPFDAGALAGMGGVLLLDGREYLTREDYYKRDQHWRPSGHRKTAERLAAMIAGGD